MAANPKTLQIKDEYLARVLTGEEFLLEDGGMGTMLQARGLLAPGTNPDVLNLTHPEEITAIHREYVEAGSQLVTTNTFGANRLKLPSGVSVQEIFQAAANNARAAGAQYVAGDIGPIGTLLQPLGTLSFEEAYDIFAEQAKAAAQACCDVVIIETMADLREAKAAVLAVRENTNLPIFVSMTFGEDGRTFLGTSPALAAATLSSLGVSAVGVNCSLGPAELTPLVQEMAQFARCPLLVKPNAGLPHIVDGETVYDVTPEEFAQVMQPILQAGASIVGGCCGTNPSFIKALSAAINQAGKPYSRDFQEAFVVTSAQEMVVLSKGEPHVAVIGERINPTGKPKLKEALRNKNYDYVIGEAVAQTQAGADILDVNAGLPDIDESETLQAITEVLQGTITAPLQIDSSDPVAIEAAVRGYAGKPLINSVNGKQSSLAAVLPIACKYGCSLVGLTLDDQGIPPTAEGRLAIARRIVETAEQVGIPRSDIAIDCLVMAAATNQAEINEVLRAVTLVKQHLGVRTVLGVSNVSFGMPQRSLINATFLAAAFGAGLDMPILNPLAQQYREAVEVFKVLNGQDAGATNFVANYANAEGTHACQPERGTYPMYHPEGRSIDSSRYPEIRSDEGSLPANKNLTRFILAGRAQATADATEQLLSSKEPLEIINHILVPALDQVSLKYDSGEFFLPQLMASAEAVKAGFDVLKAHMPAQENMQSSDGNTILLATVEGDIHDIGKNIVKMLLENYGFPVLDLGKDVSPEHIVEAARENNIQLVGLSALMTTTVKAMERTIEALNKELPQVKVMVGGAVLTPEYAQEINADYYAKDAAASAKIAKSFFS